MTGWTHRYSVLADSSVSVAPTSTTLASIPVASHTSVSGIISNTSLTQDLAIVVSHSWDGVARWATLDALNASQFSEPIAPGESRHFQFDAMDLRNVRIQGTASGAGLTAIVSVQTTHALTVR